MGYIVLNYHRGFNIGNAQLEPIKGNRMNSGDQTSSGVKRGISQLLCLLEEVDMLSAHLISLAHQTRFTQS